MAKQEEIEKATKAFSAVPWTKAYLDRPNTCVYISNSRHRKASNEDALFGKTLNTPDTIWSCITIYDKPGPDAAQIDEVHTLMSVGKALDGWPSMLHGGVIATIIDEAMGILWTSNMYFHHKNPGRNTGPSQNMAAIGGGALTATLNITYKSPVRTPNPLVVTTRYVRREGRKDWIVAELRQYDDTTQKEVVCATAEALFIARKAML